MAIGKKGWGIVAVAFWGLMMAMLAYRELGGTRIDGDEVDPGMATESRSTWLGLFVTDGPQVGHVHLRQLPEQRRGMEGVRFTMSTQMALNLMGRDTDLRLAGALWRAVDEPLAELEMTVESMGQAMELRGELKNGELVGEVISAGDSMPLQLPMDPQALLGTGLGTASRFPAMEVGDDLRMDSFDPLTFNKTEARVRCVARQVIEVDGVGVETRLLEVTTGGFTSQAWIDDVGEVVRAETPFGLTLQRLSPERASAMAGSAAGGDLLGLTAIRPTGPRPARGLQRLSLRITGIDDGVEIPSDGLQRFDDDGVLHIASRWDDSSVFTLSEAERSRWLASDAFVQSEHPKILRTATAIVGDVDDPRIQARRIHDWVYENLEKVPVMSIPSALEVLEGRRGDCNEHTVLYAALARAVGLPTRIAIGVVWSDDLEGFYYHAWPEVWVGDGFLRLDPTLNQPRADATHLKLLEGGIETWPKLLAFLGRMGLQVIDMERE